MMQAIAEGFALMRASDLGIDLDRASEIYNRGSVIESRLIAWLEEAFDLYGQDLVGVSGSVAHTGEGAWTIETAQGLGVEVRVIADAMEFRRRSVDAPSYTGQVLSALRNRFGGHAVG
jgi:6-phosphogluconate dehydrogenase